MAKLLSREKQDIILIDDNEERMSTLSSNFDLMTVNASPTSIKGLKEVERERPTCSLPLLPTKAVTLPPVCLQPTWVR